jgi:ubiquinone biosynthesis protein Coq4
MQRFTLEEPEQVMLMLRRIEQGWEIGLAEKPLLA